MTCSTKFLFQILRLTSHFRINSVKWDDVLQCDIIAAKNVKKIIKKIVIDHVNWLVTNSGLASRCTAIVACCAEAAVHRWFCCASPPSKPLPAANRTPFTRPNSSLFSSRKPVSLQTGILWCHFLIIHCNKSLKLIVKIIWKSKKKKKSNFYNNNNL